MDISIALEVRREKRGNNGNTDFPKYGISTTESEKAEMTWGFKQSPFKTDPLQGSIRENCGMGLLLLSLHFVKDLELQQVPELVLNSAGLSFTNFLYLLMLSVL